MKEHLLKEVHGLCKEKEGKCILLTLNNAIGRASFEASRKSTIDEGIILSQAARIIRKQLFTKNECFDGNFSVNNRKSSVPIHLLHLLGLILEECKQYDKGSNNTEDMVVKLAQLIKFNAVKDPRRNNASEKNCHSKQNEPLLPLLIGLSIHSQTRKKEIVEFLASQGLSVSYNRVIEIEDDITKQLSRSDWNFDNFFCFHAVFRNFRISRALILQMRPKFSKFAKINNCENEHS